MIRIQLGSNALWSSLLMISVMFTAFIVPVMPVTAHKMMFMAVYTLICFTAIMSLKRKTKAALSLFFSTLSLVWLSGILNMPLVHHISRSLNILFFLVIVFSLIRQIATARKVSAGVILDSFVGYLLLGIIFSIFVSFISERDPGAFSFPPNEISPPNERGNMSISLYFSYVTMASLGYGDIVPVKAYTRSLATLITISGQFYIAIIVALLVGKFSAQRHFRNDDENNPDTLKQSPAD
jgi:voltage-gated potassium channel